MAGGWQVATLYITEQGARLGREGRKFLVTKDGQLLFEIPEVKIDRVLLFGNVQLTTQAMRFLLESGVETSLLSLAGRLVGRLVPNQAKNVLLRVAQFDRARDQEFCLKTGKLLVGAKMRNAIQVLQRYERNHPEAGFTAFVDAIEGCRRELDRKVRLNSVRGVEGRASAVYFRALGAMMRRDFLFTTRSRRPPADPVNAMLSLGYAMIGNEMFGALSVMGLDPYVGFLHGIDYGRPSLALDLIEEFRHVIVDRLVLELVNKEVVKPEDFEFTGEGVLLKEGARRKFFEQYERRILTSVQDEQGNALDYRRWIHRQARSFARFLYDGTPYRPFEVA